MKCILVTEGNSLKLERGFGVGDAWNRHHVARYHLLLSPLILKMFLMQ